MTTRCAIVFRPDLTSHRELVTAIRDKINETALYPMSETDIVRIAAEKMFERAFNKKPVRKRKKMYIPLNF